MGISPMMKQYFSIKENYKDALLFYRLGDFFEMFYEDAIIASKELDLTLTERNCGLEKRAPMCGIPFHAIDSYLAKLIEKGYKVAICEQTSQPDGKGIVERDVVRLVTPGTITESSMLKEDINNYLASLCYENNCVGVAWADISTGEFNHLLIEGQVSVKLNDILSRITPSEIICNSQMLTESVSLSIVKFGAVCPFSSYNEFCYEYNEAYAAASGQLSGECLSLLKEKPLCLRAAGALISYIGETQKRSLKHISSISQENPDDFMILDSNVRKTLELTETTIESKRKGSLLWLVNKTATSMGARLLRKWLNQPSINSKVINKRLDFVEELYNEVIIRDKLYEFLNSINDLERLSSRVSCGNILPTELLSLGNSLKNLPTIKQLLMGCKNFLAKELADSLKELTYLSDLILRAIQQSPHNNIKDGDFINKGFDRVLDEYKDIDTQALILITELERVEKEETGIKNLKIGFNRVFGYYIEVSKSQIDLVPYRYMRKQTVVGGERYITDELKQIENKVLQARDSAISYENQLYTELINESKKYIDDILTTAKSIANLDCLVSHSIIAREFNFSKPLINDDVNQIKIIDGRHCVVEKLLKNEDFVPNDTLLDSCENKIMLITGPNMAGKSVYMRQVALITILAHIGSFVPAKSAEISITDRIFTRVGASDDLSTGRSTFMVEMSEVSHILSNATEKCLILMDEIGRGTSTYDGLSIAWSIIEFLSKHGRAKTLFSTHYHELTELEGVIDGIKNYKLTVREVGNTIVFVRKLMRGSANRSFGIEVAGIAGLPEEIIVRAKEILKLLENVDISHSTMTGQHQMSFFNSSNSAGTEILSILKDTDIDNISPRQALDILSDLIEKVKLNG